MQTIPATKATRQDVIDLMSYDWQGHVDIENALVRQNKAIRHADGHIAIQRTVDHIYNLIHDLLCEGIIEYDGDRFGERTMFNRRYNMLRLTGDNHGKYNGDTYVIPPRKLPVPKNQLPLFT